MKFNIKGKISPVKAGVFAVLALLCVIIIISIIRKDSEDDSEFLAPVIAIKPIYGSMEKTLRITSHVETGRLITAVARVGGTLNTLNVNVGDEVSENQIIAEVDSAPYELGYLQAQSAFLTARSTFDRFSQLYQSQGVSRQNYEEVRMSFEVARAQFELAQLNMDYTKIRAPMNANVLMRHSTEGSLVGAGTPLVSLGDLGDLRVKAAIPEIHYRFFSENWETMPVRLLVPALGDDISFYLKPLSLAPYVSPENRSFLVEYEIPQGAEHGLRPGMFVNVVFILEKRENIYYLPLKVIASENRLWYITEETQTKFARSQYIELIPDFFNNDYFQISDELSGREFIYEGQHFITIGQRLNILSVYIDPHSGVPK
ncbi:MAG: efflux RND transporter periplasmic adaptor subunit [Treponema sp.]|nr:efflux RND transporter periplasmic adaptor subunit [Treponema sp.]MCL2251393.1 efflux RND transporter periplasmic adaptor subunit [Treponema sp.]